MYFWNGVHIRIRGEAWGGGECREAHVHVVKGDGQMTRLRGLLCTLEMHRKLGCRTKSVVQWHACHRGVWGTPPGEVHLDVRPNACQHLGRCIVKLHPGPAGRESSVPSLSKVDEFKHHRSPAYWTPSHNYMFA